MKDAPLGVNTMRSKVVLIVTTKQFTLCLQLFKTPERIR